MTRKGSQVQVLYGPLFSEILGVPTSAPERIPYGNFHARTGDCLPKEGKSTASQTEKASPSLAGVGQDVRCQWRITRIRQQRPQYPWPGASEVKTQDTFGFANWLNGARGYDDGTVRCMEEPQAHIELSEGRWWAVASRILAVAQWGFGVSAAAAVTCVTVLRHSSGSGSPGSIGVGVAMAGMVVGLVCEIAASIISVARAGRASCSQARRHWSRGLFISAWASSALLVFFSMLSRSGRVRVDQVMVLATAASLLWALALGGAGWLLTGRERWAAQYRRRGAVVGVLGIVSCWGTFLALVVVALSTLT